MSHDHLHVHGKASGADAGAAAAGMAAGRLRLALALTAAILVLEVAGGLLSNSLALLADAGHMLADVAALGLALFSVWFSRQPVTPHKSFGYLRWEILAALVNGTALLLVCAWIGWESIQRFRAPEVVDGGTMLFVAVIGLGANGAAAWLLRPVSVGNLNVRGAYLHVLGDLLASGGAVVASLLIIFFGLVQADGIASLVTAALIVRSAWSLVRESVDVLLEATPAHISPDAVRESMESIPGVESVHDLHIWSVSSGMIAMSAHAIVREPAQRQQVLELTHEAVRSFGINHVTVQIEGREMAVCEGDGHL